MWALLTDLDGIPLTCVEPTTAYFGISNLGSAILIVALD